MDICNIAFSRLWPTYSAIVCGRRLESAALSERLSFADKTLERGADLAFVDESDMSGLGLEEGALLSGPLLLDLDVEL